jgi:tRNA nucleotidyltransferase/poly(A) polymerase
LLGRELNDYDIATSARPDEVIKLFPHSNGVDAHFGVVIAKCSGHHIEIATFRTDGSYKDGRRPDSVTFSTAQEDAQRRDFTVNGLFENPACKENSPFHATCKEHAKSMQRACKDSPFRSLIP